MSRHFIPSGDMSIEVRSIYWVAIGTAQMASLNPTSPVLMLEEEDKKLLEGPDAAAA